MANLSLVLLVILLAGTVKTGLGDCTARDVARCQPSSGASTKSEGCRIAREIVNCLESVSEDCDNDRIRGTLDSQLESLRETLQSECGIAAAGQVSSLFMCLGLASLAYFLTKFL